MSRGGIFLHMYPPIRFIRYRRFAWSCSHFYLTKKAKALWKWFVWRHRPRRAEAAGSSSSHRKNLYQAVPVLGLAYGSRSIDVTGHPVVLLLMGHMLRAPNFPKCQQPTGVYVWVWKEHAGLGCHPKSPRSSFHPCVSQLQWWNSVNPVSQLSSWFSLKSNLMGDWLGS